MSSSVSLLRRIAWWALALSLSGQAIAEELHIGYQKYGTLTILKARGTLEPRLQALGITVKWTEFPAGPQLLEGLNVGSIDFGTVGEAPPIFAQAAGADLVYVGTEPPSPQAEAIVVPKDSTIHSVADLRGKRVVLNKGSNVHYLLVKALEKAGLRYSDIQPIYLPPADARAAFERGAVDAWAIWDPFLAAAQKQLGVRAIADGSGIVSNHQFFLASRSYATKHPEVLHTLLDELDKTDAWSKQHPSETAALLAPQLGLPSEVVSLAASRFSYGVVRVDKQVAGEQQHIADAFLALKLIPHPIDVGSAVWISN